MVGLDPRLTPARPDLAARALEGRVEAARFVDPERVQVVAPSAPMRPRPDPAAALATELIAGEPFDLYDRADGWVWGQSALDGYVGWLPEGTVGPGAVPTHLVTAPAAQFYAEPELKRPPTGRHPFGARIAVATTRDGYAKCADGWIAQDHLRALDDPEPDWVAVAERFCGAPYVWGGRSAFGLDCSALVQLSRQAGGFDCPRDSDMQTALGETLAADRPLRRGDVIFWKGHVGIMLDSERMIHATIFGMRVRIEALAEAAARIATREFGAILRRARLDPA